MMRGRVQVRAEMHDDGWQVAPARLHDGAHQVLVREVGEEGDRPEEVDADQALAGGQTINRDIKEITSKQNISTRTMNRIMMLQTLNITSNGRITTPRALHQRQVWSPLRQLRRARRGAPSPSRTGEVTRY